MPPKKTAAKGYKLAEILPVGEVVEDIVKKKWKVGPPIGNGGFGVIYSAREASSSSSKYAYVLKMEPHSNGPLFVESHFYMRNGKPEDVQAYQKNRGLKFFGMPVCHAKGSHEYKGEKYRFLIMDKFGTDLWKLFIENNKEFPVDTVFKVGIQVVDVLEYIHSRGYVHADTKAANILLGPTKETQNKQVYLVDFGLATKYLTAKEFKPDPKRAHDGTIEYLSRDAHQGVQTRRGDLEILAYNLIQWMGCVLPWEKMSDKKKVQQSKEDQMANISKFMKVCFGSKTPPHALVHYLNYLKTLSFDTEPDYNKIRKIFIAGVKDVGGSLESPFQFSSTKGMPRKRKSPMPNSPAKKSVHTKLVNELEEVTIEEMNSSPKPKRKQPMQRKQSIKQKEVLLSDEEEPIKKDATKKAGKSKTKTEDLLNSSTDGMTAAMRDIFNKMKNGDTAKNKKNRHIVEADSDEESAGYTESMKESNVKRNTRKNIPKAIYEHESEQSDQELNGYTDSMKELANKKKQRLQLTKRGISKKNKE